MLQAVRPQAPIPSRQLAKLGQILLLMAILIAAVPHAQQRSRADDGQAAPESRPYTPPAPARTLPPTLADKPELTELRTANSAVFDVGNGTYALYQTSQPLHYQDEDGAWQLVNPALAAVESGWINRTNPLQTSLARYTSAARIAASSIGTGWRPTELSVIDAQGQASVIATPLNEWSAKPGVRAGNAQAVRYRESWSNALLQDQWQTSAGSSEYTMRLAQRPSAPANAQSLDLRVELALLPGTTISVNGQRASLPLETSDAIEFVGADGVAMRLLPPRTYEQNNPDESVAGTYLLSGTSDASVVELRVRTPWSWLSAPARHYPVIIDPLFQIRSPLEYKIASYNWSDFTSSGHPTAFTEYLSGKPAAGNFGLSAQRLLVHFDLPTMPQGTTITDAQLSVAPSGAWFNKSLSMPMDAYTFDDWNSPPLAVDTPGTPLANADPYNYDKVAFSKDFADKGIHLSHDWDVTAKINQWLTTEIGAGESGGILIRARTEQPCILIYAPFIRKNCGGFYFEHPSTWTKDDLFMTEYLSDPGDIFTSLPKGAGIRLLAYYQGPTIIKGQTIDMRGTLGNVGGAPSQDPPYYHADHNYRVTSNLRDNKWTALVARGFGTPVNVPNPPEGNIQSSQGLNGSLTLQSYSSDQSFLRAKTAANSGQVGYILYDGKDAGLDQNPNVRVGAVDSSSPDNAYDVRLIDQNGTLTTALPAGTYASTQLLNYAFSTANPLGLWDINLPANSNSRVDVIVLSDNLESTAYYANAKYFNANLYPASGDSYFTTDDQHLAVNSNVLPSTPNAQISYGGVFLTSSIFPIGSAERYALALAYNGPDLVINDLIPPPPRPGSQPSEVQVIKQHSFNIRVRVTSCAQTDATGFPLFPTSAGTCQQVKCPTVSTPFRTGHNNLLGLWSEGGWSAGTPPYSSNAGSAPLIGAPSSATAPTIAVVGGKVNAPSSSSVTVTPDGGPSATVMLLSCAAPAAQPQPPSGYFSIYDGALNSATPLFSPITLLPNGVGSVKPDPWNSADNLDMTRSAFSIYPTLGRAGEYDSVTRHTGTDLVFGVSWGVDVNGMSSLDQRTSVSKVGAQTPPPIASLILNMGTDFKMRISPDLGKDAARKFMGIRFGHTGKATITQPGGLGSASKPIQGLISNRGMLVPDLTAADPNLSSENGSVIDLRNPNDPGGYDRVWTMPDIHTELSPGLVALTQDGAMQVYSADHPNAGQEFSKSFEYKGFKASVSVNMEKCTNADPNQVLVIKGEMSMTLPSLGDSKDPSGVIAAKFKLCETSLRSVHLEFKSPVGIPIGNTGLFLMGVTGDVEIYADHTTIGFDLAFQSGPGGDGGAAKFHGGVLIDTRGLFAFQGGGTLLKGKVNVDGKLWVAWNPLDVGFEVDLKVGDWLKGFARAHMWKGQGFNHRYAWLPDGDETHITAQIGAELKVKKGAIGKVLIDIPPEDITIGIEVAFGQFCTNSNCTQYEWGIKGKFEVLSYDVGIYYGTDRGLDFILGNDGYVLIDQYGGAQSAPVRPSGSDSALNVRKAAPVVAGTATEPFTVTAQTEQVLTGLGWRAGNPHVTLIAPDGTRLDTLATQTTYTTVISDTGLQTMIALQRPSDSSKAWEGVWNAEISGLSGDSFFENYQFMAFMNRGAPGTPADYQFTSPASDAPATSSYTIRWSVPADTSAAPNSTISLFYTKLPDPTDPLTGNLGIRVPIRYNLPFSDGQYVWDMRGLATGAYQIYATVDDGVNELPVESISQPDDMCTPLNSGLPHARAFDPARFPGTVAFTSTGTIQYTDNTPPPAPSGLQVAVFDGELYATWDTQAANDFDTVNYILHWTQDTPQALVDSEDRIVADEEPGYRIGGLTNDLTATVELQAADSTGNLSSKVTVTAVPTGTVDPVPFQPQTFTTTLVTANSASFTWEANPSGPTPASYRVLTTDVLSGTSSEMTVNTPSATVSGLTIGRTYDVQVSANNNGGWHSVGTDAIRVMATSGVDANNDGMADDWAAAYGLTSASADDDGDGLTNAEEYAAHTNPHIQDSDNDGFSDYEELNQGSPLNNADALDGTEVPSEYIQPRLVLSEDELNFKALEGPTSVVSTQAIDWSNVSSGTLSLATETDAPWINASANAAQLIIGIDPSHLNRGFYSGIVRVKPAPGSDPLIGAQTCVRVNVWVDSQVGGLKMFLPVMYKNATTSKPQAEPLKQTPIEMSAAPAVAPAAAMPVDAAPTAAIPINLAPTLVVPIEAAPTLASPIEGAPASER